MNEEKLSRKKLGRPTRAKNTIGALKIAVTDKDKAVASHITSVNDLPDCYVPNIIRMNQLAVNGEGTASQKANEFLLKAAMGIDNKKKFEGPKSPYEVINGTAGNKAQEDNQDNLEGTGEEVPEILAKFGLGEEIT